MQGNAIFWYLNLAVLGASPQAPQHQAQLFAMSYDAEHVLWNPIAVRADSRGDLPTERMSPVLRQLRYSDGSPVVGDHALNAPSLVRDILLALDKMDDVAYKELGYSEWSEENQRSAKNSPYIYQAVMDVLRKTAPPVRGYAAGGGN